MCLLKLKTHDNISRLRGVFGVAINDLCVVFCARSGFCCCCCRRQQRLSKSTGVKEACPGCKSVTVLNKTVDCFFVFFCFRLWLFDTNQSI